MAPHLPPPTPGSSHHPKPYTAPSAAPSSSDYSYFSPHAPFTSPGPSTSTGTFSAPNSPLGMMGSYSTPGSTAQPSTTTTTTTTTAPSGGPIITATVTLRNCNGSTNSVSAGTGTSYLSSGHQSDVLQQFALHIPPPPPLSLSLSAIRNPQSSAGAGSSSSGGGGGGGGGGDMRLPSSSPQMTLSSTPMHHTLSVLLPRNVQPEMVTISANKGDRIRVVADAWGGGKECHYEWQISFPPHDIDMGSVHARFDPDGRLTLDVRRMAASRARYY